MTTLTVREQLYKEQYFSNKRTERVILRPRAEESPGMRPEKVDNPEILHSAPLRSE